MLIPFTKMHGLGNDFIMIDAFNEDYDIAPESVKLLCDRHFGIGADGIILVEPAHCDGHAGYMHYINADGTLAQMCGNGVRCFAKFVVDNGYLDDSASCLTADTLAGPRDIAFTRNADGTMNSATVDMGAPVLDPSYIPTNLAAGRQTPEGLTFVGEQPLDSPWGTFNFTCVSMGNPHAVAFIEDWNALPDEVFSCASNKSLVTFDIDKVGSYFESHSAFPEKSNIEFADIQDDGIHMRVYERGCAETLACGTGACATNVAAALLQKAPRENDVILAGGTLHINWREDGTVLMTGPATTSFSGVVDIS